MVNYGDEDFFANPNAFDYNNDSNQYGYNDEEPVQQQPRTRTRQRRASVSGAGPLTRTRSADDVLGGQLRPGSRRPEAAEASASNRSIENRNASNFNSQFEAVGAKGSRPKTGSSGDRSVVQKSHSGERRAGTRRASLAAGASALTSRGAIQPRQHRSTEEADYGYGYGYDDNSNKNSYEYDDMGYGDDVEEEQQQQAAVQEEPVRARRQRRCSIADVVNTTSIQPTENGGGDSISDNGGADYNPAPPSRGIPGSASQRTGISSAAINNIAIPMMASEEPKRANRRGSIAMLGNIGRNKPSKEPEPLTTKKPVADRDRHRQGTLLDRVGASNGDGRGGNKAGATSYSDRIMSK